MNATGSSNPEKPTRAKFLPGWLAYPLALILYGVIPWAIALLTTRYGWTEDSPGFWNLLGLIPVVVGITGLVWTMSLHFAQAPRAALDLAQNYLLTHGPYTFSRHPMYLSELAVLLGWTIFYGSIAVLVAFVVGCIVFNFVSVPLEERALEARFGEVYRAYKERVPRWF